MARWHVVVAQHAVHEFIIEGDDSLDVLEHIRARSTAWVPKGNLVTLDNNYAVDPIGDDEGYQHLLKPVPEGGD